MEYNTKFKCILKRKEETSRAQSASWEILYCHLDAQGFVRKHFLL